MRVHPQAQGLTPYGKRRGQTPGPGAATGRGDGGIQTAAGKDEPSEGVKEAVRQILDEVIRNPWAKAAGIVKKSFGREEDEGVRQGLVGDSALFAGRIATLYGIGEKLLQEFEEKGPDRTEIAAGETRILLLDIDADTLLVGVIDTTAEGQASAVQALEDARARLRKVG